MTTTGQDNRLRKRTGSFPHFTHLYLQYLANPRSLQCCPTFSPLA
jgi:hypothetical protein